MSEGEIAEELPNGDDSAFEEQQSDKNETTHGTVYVDSAEGVITAEHYQDDSGKTTHIVIHDQALDSGLKTPTTPLPPPTPATPLSRERGLRYQWDDSAHNEVLPVRCKNQNGELHKYKFGSGRQEFQTKSFGTVSGSGTGPLDYGSGTGPLDTDSRGPVPDTELRL